MNQPSLGFRPTGSGGRIVYGDTPWGRFSVEWTPAGELVSHEIELRDPRPAPDEYARSLSLDRPGDLLAWCIFRITGEVPSSGCKCKERTAEMNGWGWWGCWRRRSEIGQWLAEEASRRGHDVGDGVAMGLIRAAIRERRRRGAD